jgi:hypothetical protein
MCSVCALLGGGGGGFQASGTSGTTVAGHFNVGVGQTLVGYSGQLRFEPMALRYPQMLACFSG